MMVPPRASISERIDALTADDHALLALDPLRERSPFHARKSLRQCSVVDRVTYPLEPLVHQDAVLSHPLADHLHRYLEIRKWFARHARENGDRILPAHVVACKVVPRACEAIRILERLHGASGDIRDSDLRELPRSRERRGVNP